MYPTHYTGEPHYFSDTEDSVVIKKGEEEQESGGEDQDKKQDREHDESPEDSIVISDRIEPEPALKTLQAAKTKEEL